MNMQMDACYDKMEEEFFSFVTIHEAREQWKALFSGVYSSYTITQSDARIDIFADGSYSPFEGSFF